MDELGLVQWRAYFAQVLGTIDLLAGDPRAAEEHLRWGYERLEATGERASRWTHATMLGEALLAQHRDTEAEHYCRLTMTNAGPDDLLCQIDWRLLEARLLLRRDEVAAAERLAREAVAIAAPAESPRARGDAQRALAEVLAAAGRPLEAARAFEEALARYEAKGILPLADAVRRELATLGSARPTPPG